jgi:hypothetical protein
MPTVEDVRDHIARVRDEAGYIVPTSVADEMAIIEKHLS